ncbi:MAG: HAMP domain-containing histidine kinase, partial [Myxococcales bacterium]|nr:HAMP domain-containing histidine kinase [Myxococcales bacterium]
MSATGFAGKGSLQLRRLRLALVVAGLAMLLGLGLLLARSLAATRAEQQLRREALAARVFEELEATLAAFVAEEEARPFVQWRHEWVPPVTSKSGQTEAGTGEPRPSPLASLPARAFVRGYFQVDPDGRFSTPLLAEDGTGEGGGEAPVLARADELRTGNADLLADTRLAYVDVAQQQRAEPQQQQLQKPMQQKQQAVPEDLQLQQVLDQQSIARQRKNAVANLDDFDPDNEQLANFIGSSKGNAGAQARAAGTAEVRTAPFVGEALAGGRLRLLRTVEIDGQLWLQGLILDRAALEAWLERELVGAAAVEGYLALDWSPGPADPDRGLWVHDFGPPFVGLRLGVELPPAATLATAGARWILGLGLGLGLALLIGLVAVERSVAGLLARAEERERFIAAVTHELRTPLTSIRMYSEMLEQGMVTDADRRHSYHSTIRSEAERLSRLVEQVLTLAPLEGSTMSGTMLGAGQRERVGEVVDRVVAVLEPQAAARGLGVEVELDGVAEAALPGDALAQILTNVLDNAIKFS